MPASRTTILAAVSSPWAGENLVAPLADLATRLDAGVVVTHIAKRKNDDESEVDATTRGDRTLSVLTEGLQARGINVERVMVFSRVTAKAILDTAHQRNCQLIVIGVTGTGLLRRWLGLDVPSRLAQISDLPVLLVPHNWAGVI